MRCEYCGCEVWIPKGDQKTIVCDCARTEHPDPCYVGLTAKEVAAMPLTVRHKIITMAFEMEELEAENKRLREASEWIEEYGLARIHEVFQWVYEYLYDDAMSMPQSPGGNPPCECPWCGEIFEMATDHKDDCELVQMTMEVQRINYHLAKALPEPPKEQQP